MPDTVSVAVIAVAGTLGSGLLSYLAARRSTAVQLAGVNVELEGLQRTHAERDRQARQELYLNFLVAFNDVRELSHGELSKPLSSEELWGATGTLSRRYFELELMGSDEVAKIARELVDALEKVGSTVSELEKLEDDKSSRRLLSDALEQHEDEWSDVYWRLIRTMKAEISSSGVAP